MVHNIFIACVAALAIVIGYCYGEDRGDLSGLVQLAKLFKVKNIAEGGLAIGDGVDYVTLTNQCGVGGKHRTGCGIRCKHGAHVQSVCAKCCSKGATCECHDGKASCDCKK
jgi:hypothetical protein